MSATTQCLTATDTLPAAPITITPAAALKSWELIQEADQPGLKLRVSILGGGCHGFRYEFSFAESTEPDDTVITQTLVTADKNSTVDWVLDALSLQLLHGIEIDYEEGLGGERFIIRNLKVKTTCSCGSSFAVADTEESGLQEQAD